jgi:hypothetical protein
MTRGDKGVVLLVCLACAFMFGMFNQLTAVQQQLENNKLTSARAQDKETISRINKQLTEMDIKVTDLSNQIEDPTSEIEAKGGKKVVEANDQKCLNLDFDGNMDAMIASARHIFITMPAKAAGTSLTEFTKKCTKSPTMNYQFINSLEESEKFLSGTLHLPSIITSHLTVGDLPLVDLAQHSTRNTMIVHIHRDETDRLLSGIRMAFTEWVCNRKVYKVGSTKDFHINRNETHCLLDEGPAINMIKRRVMEIGMGSPEILTCKAYKAIEENEPNIAFLHYKQVNKLQRLLAQHHCPELLDEPPLETNVAKDKRVTVYLRLQKGGNVVKLDDWLHEKGDLLEWSLKLRKNATCQVKTKHMEDDLFACKDEAIKVTSEGVGRW